MKKVSMVEGKSKFVEIVDHAVEGEPHLISKYGRPTAVVMSVSEYEQLVEEKGRLSHSLQVYPKATLVNPTAPQ